MTDLQYKVEVTPLSDDEGGGYMASVPALPGCMSDGETPAEAIENLNDAIDCWIDAARELGRPIPRPERVREHA